MCSNSSAYKLCISRACPRRPEGLLPLGYFLGIIRVPLPENLNNISCFLRLYQSHPKAPLYFESKTWAGCRQNTNGFDYISIGREKTHDLFSANQKRLYTKEMFVLVFRWTVFSKRVYYDDSD